VAGTGGSQKPGVARAAALIAPFTVAGALSVRRAWSLPASLTTAPSPPISRASVGFR
jgi:hypothetical protein